MRKTVIALLAATALVAFPASASAQEPSERCRDFFALYPAGTHSGAGATANNGPVEACAHSHNDVQDVGAYVAAGPGGVAIQPDESNDCDELQGSNWTLENACERVLFAINTWSAR